MGWPGSTACGTPTPGRCTPRSASGQRNWVLGLNAWGSSFVIGAGSVSPRCAAHQVANLAKAGPLVGAVVNGPNRASLLRDLNGFDTMRSCSAKAGSRPFSDYDGKGARYADQVGAWQTVEPAIDFTANAVLAFSLSVR